MTNQRSVGLPASPARCLNPNHLARLNGNSLLARQCHNRAVRADQFITPEVAEAPLRPREYGSALSDQHRCGGQAIGSNDAATTVVLPVAVLHGSEGILDDLHGKKALNGFYWRIQRIRHVHLNHQHRCPATANTAC